MENSSGPHSRTLNEIGEFELIALLTQAQTKKLPQDMVGPGDDCAVLPLSFLFPGEEQGVLLLTSDTMVEDRHFRIGHSNAFDLGWKLLATTISDIAAMGGAPRVVLISLQLPKTLSLEWLKEVYQGVYALAEDHEVHVVGGDTVSAETLAFSVSAVGISSDPPILRSGANVGDDVWVSGVVGLAGAGLSLLEGGLQAKDFPDGGQAAIRKYRLPEPRIELGEALSKRKLAGAMIDVSDGLLQDAGHLAKQSDCQFLLKLQEIPLAAGIVEAGYSAAEALSAGEDYELLFTASPSCADKLYNLSREIGGGVELPLLNRVGAVCHCSADKIPGVYIKIADNDVKQSSLWLKELGFPESGGFQHLFSS